MFERENQRLRQQDDQLHGKLEKLQRLNDQMHERLNNVQGQNVKQKEQIDQMQGELRKLHRRNKKLQGDNSKLHGENKALRQADSAMEASVRQKDQIQNGTSEFDEKLKNSTQLKKIVNSEIVNYLLNERICVSGSTATLLPDDKWNERAISFGYSFPRNPSVSASFDQVFSRNSYGQRDARVKVKSVSKSSAVLKTRQNDQTASYVAWIACL